MYAFLHGCLVAFQVESGVTGADQMADRPAHAGNPRHTAIKHLLTALLSHMVWATMRIALFLLPLAAAGLLASSIVPSVDLSAAVFTGKVLSAEKVKVVGKDDDSRWELWRAEVKLQAVVTQDVRLVERVFVYYPQDWYTNYVTADGSHVWRGVTSGCPGRPRVATNQVYKFFCVRQDVEDRKSTRLNSSH